MLQVRGVKGQRLGCQCLCELEWVLKDVVEGGALNAGLALILNIFFKAECVFFMFLEDAVMSLPFIVFIYSSFICV